MYDLKGDPKSGPELLSQLSECVCLLHCYSSFQTRLGIMSAKLRVPRRTVLTLVSNTGRGNVPSTPLISTSSSVAVPSIATPRASLNPIAESRNPSPLTLIRNISHAATMSTMPAAHGHNEACCNIPPIEASVYTAKGCYEQLGGMKTCKIQSSNPFLCSLTDQFYRYNRPNAGISRYHLSVRHLWLYRPDVARCRHPSKKAQSLHARLVPW